MAITLSEVKNYIDCIGGSILKEHDEAGISVVAFSKYNDMLEKKNSYVVFLMENGEMFQLNNGIGTIGDFGLPADQVSQALLNHNSETKFGTWELDKEDGQVKHAVEIPLEDNTLTEKQFKRIVGISEQSTMEFLKMMKELYTSSSDGI